jgi:prepilin-type N-terminal cleavage/methylation domain-containing protein
MRPRVERRGVTLLELLVALAIAGLAMLGGVLLLDQVDDSARRIDAESRRDALDNNGERALSRLLADARGSSDTADRFRGDDQNASFLGLCDMPSGWPELCRVGLSITSEPDSSAVVAQPASGPAFAVARVAGPAAFRYLDAARSGDSAWLARWTASIALPAALALITPVDTTVFPLGSVRD